MTGSTVAVQPDGTGRLADDLYLMARNHITGRPYLQPRAIAMGLAGPLLAELRLAGRLNTDPGGTVAADRIAPADRLAAGADRPGPGAHPAVAARPARRRRGARRADLRLRRRGSQAMSAVCPDRALMVSSGSRECC
jgi:hypothetical protein